MEVGAEIELTEDGALEELPLHLENAKNCLSWESLDFSSSDDDGEAYFTFCLPVTRPSRPVQRLPVQRLPVQRPPGPRFPAQQRLAARPLAPKPAACEKWVPPLYPYPVRPILPTLPAVPVFGAYQCQKCLQVFMEEWHYSQHLEDHTQEEAQLRAAQARPRPHSPPRKLRCLECGKRFLRPEHFARHTKWHLKLVRKGIKVSRRKASRRPAQVSFIYKPLGGSGDQPEVINEGGFLVAPQNANQPAALQGPRVPKASKRKAPKHQKRGAVQVVQSQALAESCLENSMAVLGGDIALNLLQPWQKQEAILEGQVAGGLFQPGVLNPENQIIIVDDETEEALSVTPEHHHYAEVQTAVFDSQGDVNAARPLFLRAEDPAALLDAQVSLSSLQFGGAKDAGWVGPTPCTLFRTVLLQAEEPQATLVDGRAESGPLQQVIIKTSEVSPTLYLDPDTHLSSVDPAALHFVPVHQEPQFVTVPCGDALTLDQADPAVEGGEKTEETQVTAFQFPGYFPDVCQQNKQPPPTVATSLSPKGSLVVRLVPGPSGDHPEVLDLEYDTGGGIPVASEPWEATNARTGSEAYATEEVTEEEEEGNFIVVEMEEESQGQGFVVGPLRRRPRRRRARRRTRKPKVRTRVWRFKCPDCGVRYGRLSQLRSHQKGGGRRGRSYLCECGAPFRGLLHLLRHQLQHLDEALFICATCGASLKGHGGLARHGTCHPGPARFSCPCGVGFKRLTRYLWHHVRSQKPGLRVYTLSGFLAST